MQPPSTLIAKLGISLRTCICSTKANQPHSQRTLSRFCSRSPVFHLHRHATSKSIGLNRGLASQLCCLVHLPLEFQLL